MENSRPLHEVAQIKAGVEIYVKKGKQVMMFKRSPTSSMFPNYWVGPGGHVDEKEDFLKAGIRELEEETGIKVTSKDIKLKVIAIQRRMDRKEVWILPMFLATLSKNQQVNSSEEGKGKWISQIKLFEMEDVLPSSKYYLDHIINDKPGILYTNIEWNNKGLVEVTSVTLDTDS